MLRINWNQEHVTFLKERLGKRQSASEIADAMTKEFGVLVTRSSVMGKCHRMNLQLNGRPKPRGREPKPKIIRIFKRSPSLPPPPPPPESYISLSELEEGRCHYPHGVAAPYKYCGAPSDGIYCAFHAKISFVEPRKRSKL